VERTRQSTSLERRIRAATAIVLAGILGPSADVVAQRVRDEVVELSSGDRVTGEIKGLDRSQLTVRTIDLGTVQIRWQRVVRLNSNRTLEVELADGRRLQGSVVSATPGTLDVSGTAGTVNVNLASIVVIRPVARSWIGDLTGRIDAGFSYTRGSGVAQTSASAEVTTRRPAFQSTFTFNAVLTKVEDQSESSRYLLGYRYYRFRTGRVFVGGLADAQRNRDLGISFRASVGAGPGYRMLKSQRQELTVLGGPVVVREVPFQDPGSTDVLALATTNYSLFLNEYPKTNLDIANQLRFGLSEPGRFLLDLNASVRRELWRDFYIAATLYNSYDNRPPASSTIRNDVGVTVTLGWTF
jgi:putative salt-induced outer membrane protein YdiY